MEFSTPQAQLTFSAELRNVIQQRNLLTSRTRQKVLSALDEINKNDVDSKRLSLRQQAIQEILTSEVTYLNQLEILMKYFMKPLHDRQLIPVELYNTIFGNVETIYNINKELLKELKQNPDNIAVAILKLAPFLKLYSVYAYDYKKTLESLQKAQSTIFEFNKFLEQQESRPEVSKKLSALLITPIQRVPRYRLLIKQVLTYTLPSHPDHSVLLKSLNEIESVAFHINSLVEEQESAQKLLELQRSLCNDKPNIIKPGRYLIKQGFVMKMSKNGSHGSQRYFILMNDIIMYCKLIKNKPTEPRSLQCCCILPLHKCRITEVASKGVFTITCQTEALMFYCETVREVEQWINALQQAIKMYISCRKTLRKDSSSRRPVRKQNIFEFEQHVISPGQPRRKRRLPLKEYDEEIYRNSGSDSDNEKPTDCFVVPRKSAKRVKRNKVVKSDQNSDESKDVLYPLRESENINEQTDNKQDDICKFDLVRSNRVEENASSGSKVKSFLSGIGSYFWNIFKTT